VLCAGLTLLGCVPFVPRSTGHLALTSEAYVEDGVSLPRDFFRSNLKKAVKDTPGASSHADASQRNRIAGLAFVVTGIVTGISSVLVGLTAPEKMNAPAAQALTIGSLASTIIGPVFLSRAVENELDAINEYNDARRTGTSP
jgi:hypothetical protein